MAARQEVRVHLSLPLGPEVSAPKIDFFVMKSGRLWTHHRLQLERGEWNSISAIMREIGDAWEEQQQEYGRQETLNV
jgi:hypothetical protein